MSSLLTTQENHEELRKKLWVNAWVNVAAAATCTDPKAATRWADIALNDFDERFKKPNITNLKPSGV